MPTNNSKASMPNVHNYLIEAHTCHRMDGQVMPFPKQFMFWSRGCYLTAPTEGILGLDENGKLSKHPPYSLPFNVSIPKAVAVAVVVGGKWTELDSMGDCWKSSVQMKQHWGTEKKLTVLAKYAASDTAYSPLLEYSLAV
ncbi:unnamed protein product [Dibothriocephalus latus]|uniref:Uncharacterized protein n=1 Tax=Dibothriocephalus latus TaxID=60516 RepID=A0A3P7LZN2_DIBLA|nr:unnamed protein product [Dibothriocephalus latus]